MPRTGSAPSAASTQRLNATVVADWRLARTFVPKPIVGPTTYTPTRALTARSSPSFGFGTSHRFGCKTQFHTSGHISELLCRQSPGPIYRPLGYPDKKAAPTWSVGPQEPILEEVRKEREMMEAKARESELGPASYTPSMSLTKQAVPQSKFETTPRFHETQPYMNESAACRIPAVHAYKPSPDHYSPRDGSSSPRARVHAMGPSAYKATGEKMPFPPGGREGFLTDDLRSGRAKPATSIANIAGATYTPRADSSAKASSKFSFGKNDRFKLVDPQFHSKSHVMCTNMGLNSPGPKYKVPSKNELPQSPRGGALQWVP